MNLPLRTWLWLAYGTAAVLPVGLYLAFSRPQTSRAAEARDRLADRTLRIHEKTAEVEMVVKRIQEATPPPAPSPEARLEQVAAVRVPGVRLLALDPLPEAAPPRLRVLARGGYREIAAYLEALSAAPFPVRVAEMDLAPSPEEGLTLCAVVEAGP